MEEQSNPTIATLIKRSVSAAMIAINKLPIKSSLHKSGSQMHSNSLAEGSIHKCGVLLKQKLILFIFYNISRIIIEHFDQNIVKFPSGH